MITIHQIQLTSDQIDAVNAGSKVEAFEPAKRLLEANKIAINTAAITAIIIKQIGQKLNE